MNSETFVNVYHNSVYERVCQSISIFHLSGTCGRPTANLQEMEIISEDRPVRRPVVQLDVCWTFAGSCKQ